MTKTATSAPTTQLAPVPGLFNRILSITSRFAASLLGQITAYAAAITGAVVAFEKLNEPLHTLPLPVRVGIVIAPVALALATHTIPTLLAEFREKRDREISGSGLKPGYFSLGPRGDTTWADRADNTHTEVLGWIQQRKGRVLYLTGLSGSGKSSLLKAWVLPHLDGLKWRIISLRGYQDVVGILQNELKRPGVIWQKSPDGDSDTLLLLQKASRYMMPSQLLIVLDQFEEFLILQDKTKVDQLEQLLLRLASPPIPNLTFLLVFRSDYIGQIGKLNLPRLLLDDNWKEVPPFTERDAQQFMQGSGLDVDSKLLRGVLREAAELEQTKGLIRPVTINLCGLVLGRFSGGVPRGFRPGTLIRGFLRESVTLPSVRNIAVQILPKMISSSITKIPRTVDDLARECGRDKTEVRDCLLVLGQINRAIVRPLDPQQETWEISHDFLVPLLDSIVSRVSLSLWPRVRFYVPWLAALVLILAFQIFSNRAPSGPRFGKLSVSHTSDVAAYTILDQQQRLEPKPFPVSRGGQEPILKLSDVFGKSGPAVVNEIEKAGKIVFHAVGSTGHVAVYHKTGDQVDASEDQAAGVGAFTDSLSSNGQLWVADKMEQDFGADAPKPNPSFFFLLGDVIYSFGESQYYYGQFYLPYVQYPAPILAIAGNHDGMVVLPTRSAQLNGFVTRTSLEI